MRRQVVILGGGTSVIEGIRSGLFDQLKDKFTVGLNYSHHFIDTTFLMYVDATFANDQKYYLERLPLVIGMDPAGVFSNRPNIIWLPATTEYSRDCRKGIYQSSLVGLFALSFMIYILDESEIFLLGYDYGAQKGSGEQRVYNAQGKALTHWYQHGDIKSIYTGEKQQISHRGIGKVNWYEATHVDEKTQKRITRAEHEFGVYCSEKKVSIYNVSIGSRINTFPKISYDQFFAMLDKQTYAQDILRKEVADKAVALRERLQRD